MPTRIANLRIGTPFSGDNAPAVRYYLEDHPSAPLRTGLGNCSFTLESNGSLFSREDFAARAQAAKKAFENETSFGSFTKKRYRFCGKERDEESGLYYYGARYYAAWTCRFVSVDPLAGKYPFYTPYQYAGNKPIIAIDLDGLEGDKDPGQGEGPQGDAENLSSEKPPIWFEHTKMGEIDIYYLHMTVNLNYEEGLEDNPTEPTDYWYAKKNLLADGADINLNEPLGLKAQIIAAYTSDNNYDPRFKANNVEFRVRPEDIVLEDRKSPIEFRVVEKIEGKDEKVIGLTSETGNVNKNLVQVEINSRNYKPGSTKSSQLLRTFLHEIGHVLGLRHPKDDRNTEFNQTTEIERVRAAGLLNLMNQQSDAYDSRFFLDSDAKNTQSGEFEGDPTYFDSLREIKPLDRIKLNYAQFQTILQNTPVIRK